MSVSILSGPQVAQLETHTIQSNSNSNWSYNPMTTTLEHQLSNVERTQIDTTSRCRSCFEATGLIDIFNTHINNTLLWEIITYCTNERVYRNNGLPSKLCTACFEKFKTTYSFIREFRQTQKKLAESMGASVNNCDYETTDTGDNSKRFLDNIKNETGAPSTSNGEQYNDELYKFMNEFEIKTPVNSFKKKYKKLNSVYKELCDIMVQNKKQLLRPDVKCPQLNAKKIIETFGQGKDKIDDIVYNEENYTINDAKTKVINEIIDKHVESYTNEEVNGTTNYEVYALSPSMPEESKETFLKDFVLADPRKEANTQCFECLTVFQSGADLRRHAQETGHDIPPRYKCTLCGKHFKFRHAYRNHLRNHKISAQDSVCEICGACVRTTSLPRHMERHGSRFTCDICGNTFSQRAYLRDHIKKHQAQSENSKKELCHICGVRRINLSGLNQHMNKKHGESTTWAHRCNLCTKSFISKNSLALHVHKMHVQQRPGGKPTIQKTKRTRLIRPKLDDVNQEQKRKTDPKKIVQCTICTKPMTYGTLYHHMRIHMDQKPYQCKVCAKTFRQCHHLKSHMNIHLDLKPYECQFCKKCFRHQTTLVIHTRSHTGETPYVCSFCFKGFAHSSSMKKHEETHVKKELIR